MNPELTLHTLADDADCEALAALASDAFAFPPEQSRPYLEMVGPEHVRIVKVGGDVAGGLCLIPMGQWWGGQVVPMTGIAAVVVGPQWRSRGVGAFLLKRVLEELRRGGVALSALYPATQPLYRKVGFEVAGQNVRIKVPLESVTVRENGVEVVALEGVNDAVRELYARTARGCPGNADRGAFLWRRVYEFRGKRRQGYGLLHEGVLEGYFYYRQLAEPGSPRILEIADVVVTTPRAARRFWQFLGDHQSMVGHAMWTGSANEPLLLELREQKWEYTSSVWWMLRLVDVAAALQGRGYGVATTGMLELEVEDRVLPENSGVYRLQVKEGRGAVERAAGRGSGRGGLVVEAGALPPLYSGKMTAEALAGMGRLSGPAESQALATALFAGPAPSMRDPF